jgi:hypothetical protein
MTVPDTDDEDVVETVMRNIFRQSDLSLELDRNADDSEFLRGTRGFRDDAQPGRMTFVFDSNIFEVFVDPTISRARQASFHSEEWGEGMAEGRISGRDCRTIAAQTAALTTEYLFSDAFLKRGDGNIYLTEFHYKELTLRVRQLIEELGKLRPTAAHLKTRFDSIRSARVRLKRARKATDVNTEFLRGPLLDDVQDIMRKGHMRPPRLASFVANRLVLDILIEDQRLEALDQIERLVAPDFSARMRLLHAKFRPTAEDLAQIDRDAEVWLDRFQTEIGRSRQREERSRSIGAMRTDAKSLSFVLWVARTLAARTEAKRKISFEKNRDELIEDEERIVFITADDVIFDAYRGWYAELDAGHPDFRLPFVLRRLIQYAPMFNLSDAESNFGDNAREFFRRLRVAVELASLPVNLSPKDTSHRYRMREKDALRLKRAEPMWNDLSYGPLAWAIRRNSPEARKHELNELLDYWRLVERMALGLFDDLVQARLTQMERNLPELRQDDPDSYEKAFSDYFSRRVAALIDNSINFALPLARDFIRSWERKNGGERPRVPIAFSLRLAGDNPLDLGTYLRRAISKREENPFRLSDDIWQAMERQPEAIFSVAAWLSLVSENWREAERYAEQGLLATRFVMAPEPRLTEAQAEMAYLFALTKRFQIAAQGRPEDADARHRLHGFHREARDLIEQCLATPWTRAQSRQRLRARSERAALNLFYAATFKVPFAADDAGPGAQLESRIVAHTAPDRATTFLSRAFDDIADCCDLYNDVWGDQTGGEDVVAKRIREQFAINFASAYVLNRMWKGPIQADQMREEKNVDAFILDLIPVYFKDGPDVPPLLKLSLLSYLFLTDRRDLIDNAFEELKALSQYRGGRLILDAQFHDDMARFINHSWWHP